MKIMIIFSVLMGLLIFVTVYFCNTYNKLVLLKNDINDLWIQINEDIKYRIQLINTFLPVVSNYLDEESRNTITALINKYDVIIAPEDIINVYIELEKHLMNIKNICASNNIVVPEWDKAFNDNKDKIVNNKITYNDKVLKYNAMLLAQRSATVGKLAKLTTLTYFRSEE